MKKDLTVFTLVYNLVRMVMLQASERRGVTLARISFIDALRWPAEARRLAQLIDLVVNPHRPGRYEPRIVKRRPKSYPLVTRPGAELKQAMRRKGKAA